MTNGVKAFVAGCLVATAGIISAASASAQEVPNPPCVTEAAAFHAVNDDILRAIIWQESSNRQQVVTSNSNGTVDVGLGGINSTHFNELAKYGIAPSYLLNGCVNVYVAAWHYRKQVNAFGNTWAAVAAYHSRNPEYGIPYAELIKGHLRRWGVLR